MVPRLTVPTDLWGRGGPLGDAISGGHSDTAELLEKEAANRCCCCQWKSFITYTCCDIFTLLAAEVKVVPFTSEVEGERAEKEEGLVKVWVFGDIYGCGALDRVVPPRGGRVQGAIIRGAVKLA